MKIQQVTLEFDTQNTQNTQGYVFLFLKKGSGVVNQG